MIGDKWKRLRQSTNVQDWRVERDINEPVLKQGTWPATSPAEVTPEKTRADRFRSQISKYPLEQMDFKTMLKRRRNK